LFACFHRFGLPKSTPKSQKYYKKTIQKANNKKKRKKIEKGARRPAARKPDLAGERKAHFKKDSIVMLAAVCRDFCFERFVKKAGVSWGKLEQAWKT
jgi:hypothetical protein